MGINILLAIKPGKSLTTQGTFNKVLLSSTIVSDTVALVFLPLIISTSFMIGTGFIKCIPITCSGLLVTLAISEIEIEEVLLAKMAWAGAAASSASKIESLIALFSVAASTTKSALDTAVARVVLVVKCARANSF